MKTEFTPKQKVDFERLTDFEKKIYKAIKKHFPATSHDSCMDYAINGGVKFQYYPKEVILEIETLTSNPHA